jgi:hypothetical protein
MMSPVVAIENSENCTTVFASEIGLEAIRDQTEALLGLAAARASSAARKLLHEIDCNPRDRDFFNEIDISLISDVKMGEIRDLICGTLAVRDMRTWSSNGKRISTKGLTTFLGKNFDFLFRFIISISINFNLIDFPPFFNSRTLLSKWPTTHQGCY